MAWAGRSCRARSVEVHLQPIIALHDHHVAGVEALLRWTHPQLGRVRPDEIIALAEETGLIVPLGRHILLEACRALVQVRVAGHDIPLVAVNTSASQLLLASFVADVDDALTQTGLPPESLTIEVTEGILRIASDLGLPVVAEGVETYEQAARVRGMGCDLAQGWAYAAAMPVPALPEWLEAWQDASAHEPVVLA